MTHDPIRVLQVLRSMNCGGAETLLINLHRHIDRAVVQFDYLLFWPDRSYYESEVEHLGGLVYRLPYITEEATLPWLSSLGNYFSSHRQYRIVHSHMNSVSGPILWMARRAGVPHRVAHSHNSNQYDPPLERTVKGLLRLAIMPSATHLMACSQSAADWLYGRAGKKRGVSLLKNAIDLGNFGHTPAQALRGSLGLEGKHVIGHVGSFRAQKNQAFLVDLMPTLLARRPDTVLVFVGDGPMRSQVEQQAARMGLADKVRFLGVRDDIPALMNAFDVFAFPSLFEGLGIVLIEAQATGLKCVVSDRVPKEADMSVMLMDFVSLSDRDTWVAQLLQAPGERADTLAALRANGYDIRQSAQQLQDFYKACS